jgi:hypothetical protein
VPQDSTLTAYGLQIGPYVGYKILTRIGFTFSAQLGVGYMAIKAANATAMATQKTVVPIVNLDLGWSF